MRVLPLTLEMLPVDKIAQHPENANNGDIDAIEESIEVNGFFDPIHVQHSTGYIIAGNHRYLVAVKRGLKVIPGFRHDVDDQEALRMMVAHNRTGRLGYDDEGQLANVLEQLHATDTGLAGTGYSSDDYATLLDMVNSPMSDADFDEQVREEPDLSAGQHFTIMPEVDEDGFCSSLTVTRPNLRPMSANDLNILRRSLGQDPLTSAQLATYDVPMWRKA